jgi:hypothetical protein
MAILLALCLLLAPQPPVPRGPAPLLVALSLTAKTASGEARASTGTREVLNARTPRATARAGEVPEIRWQARNTDTRKAAPELAVHLTITLADPPAAGGVNRAVLDTVVATQLAAREAAGGSCRTPIPEPGTYRVAVELVEPRGKLLRTCALLLTVEP